MKKHIIFQLLLGIFLFQSCTNDLADENIYKNDNVNKNLLEIGIKKVNNEILLKFKNEAHFYNVRNLVSKLSENEKCNLICSLGLKKSLYLIYDSAMVDAENVGETKEAYLKYKSKYDDFLYFPMYKEDLGVYLPISDKNAAVFANYDGNVMIGESIVNLKDINSYSKLQELGDAMYPKIMQPKIMSKAITDLPMNEDTENQYYSATQEKSYIGEEYSSGWLHDGKRKLQLKFGRRVTTVGPNGFFELKMHMELSFRKKTWLGWINYVSTTSTKGKYVINNMTFPVDFFKDADSSHDWYSEPLGWARVNTNCVFWVAPVDVSLVVQYQGFSFLQNYSFHMKSAYFTN